MLDDVIALGLATVVAAFLAFRLMRRIRGSGGGCACGEGGCTRPENFANLGESEVKGTRLPVADGSVRKRAGKLDGH